LAALNGMSVFSATKNSTSCFGSKITYFEKETEKSNEYSRDCIVYIICALSYCISFYLFSFTLCIAKKLFFVNLDLIHCNYKRKRLSFIPCSYLIQNWDLNIIKVDFLSYNGIFNTKIYCHDLSSSRINVLIILI
jgi:hypothetical protein